MKKFKGGARAIICDWCSRTLVDDGDMKVRAVIVKFSGKFSPKKKKRFEYCLDCYKKVDKVFGKP